MDPTVPPPEPVPTSGGDGDRTRFWPAIEARYGRPIAHWLRVLEASSATRYPDQVALLRETHGFSQAHANALVMYVRGSKSSRRFETLDAYLGEADPVGARTARAILEGLCARHPGASVEIAWNHPFLVLDGHRLLGVSVLAQHLLLAPWSVEVLDGLRPRLAAYTVNKKTIRLPRDWEIDERLLDDIVMAERARTAGSA